MHSLAICVTMTLVVTECMCVFDQVNIQQSNTRNILRLLDLLQYLNKQKSDLLLFHSHVFISHSLDVLVLVTSRNRKHFRKETFARQQNEDDRATVVGNSRLQRVQ